MPGKQANEAEIEKFIKGAPDAGTPSATHAAAVSVPGAQESGRTQTSNRKKPISLTLPDQVIEAIDRKRAALGGLSRPAFIALVVSKFEE